MSYRVVPLPSEATQEQVPEVLEVPQAPSIMDTNIFREQGKPRFIPPIIIVFYL
jgi:hypothetical protein